MHSLAETTSSNNPYPIVWATLSRYCELRGDSEKAVFRRIESGKWVYGRHVRKQDRRLYVNLPEADKWVEEGQKA